MNCPHTHKLRILFQFAKPLGIVDLNMSLGIARDNVMGPVNYGNLILLVSVTTTITTTAVTTNY